MGLLSNLSPEIRARMEQVFRRTEEQKAEEMKRLKSEAQKRTVDEQRNKSEDEREQEKQSRSNSQESDIIITPNSDYWTIKGVGYRGNEVDVNLSKTLLDNGSNKTQDEWAKYSTEAKKRKEFYTPDFPLYYSVLKAVKLGQSLNQKGANEIRSTVKKFARENWLMALTRINYNQNTPDKIIHNYKQGNEEYSVDTNFIGQDGNISNLNPTKELSALLGTDNVKEIGDVFQWLNETPTYLWRLNSRPDKQDERVARFGASSDRASLNCYRDPSDSYSSLGVRLAREKI